MSRHWLLLLLLSSWCLEMNCSNIGGTRQNINLDSDGGYTNILVGISDRIAESPDIIEKLKTYFTEASRVLLTATKNRLYFKNVTILVPKNWAAYPSSSEPDAHEKYSKARVVVEEPNLAWGDVPYTLQPGGCGEEGDYIHLTPNYVLKDPATDFTHRPAKRLVREFSHLKWGLFDEDIPISDTTSSRFYPIDEELEPIGCVGNFKGVRKDAATNDATSCDFDAATGLYAASCLFEATFTPHSGSLLNFEYLDEKVYFCGSADDEPKHNKAAPNRQNSNCDELSAWEVMNTLSDFKIDYNTTRNGESPPDTIFRIVQKATPTTTTTTKTTTQTSPPSTTIDPFEEEITTSCAQDIVCLCLDVSGSMSIANRIGIMSQSVQAYVLSFLRNGTAVGMVSFSSFSKVLAEMTVITDSGVRESLAAAAPTTSGGKTGIGAGLLDCQKLLQGYAGDNVANTRILLLTDGEENVSPYVATVLPDLVADGILIDTVLYGINAVSYGIAAQTGGKEHFASDKTGTSSLDLFFSETASRNCDEGFADVIILNVLIVIEGGSSSYSDTLYLDVTIGVNTKLVFKYDGGEIEVTVTTPQSNPVTINTYEASRVIEAVIAGVVETQVDYTITKKSTNSTGISVVTSATAGPIPGVQPIVITDRVNGADISFSAGTQLVGYVGVFQGLTPIFGISVDIIMEQSNGKVATISYTDDGTGKDSIPNDGIYTGFTPAHDISAGGFLSLKMEVFGEGFLPTSPFAVSNRRKRCVNCGSSLGNFSRTAAGNVVNIQNFIVVSDTTPPQRIKDARILKAASDGSNIFTIGWTAPGDDLSLGQVASYEFAVAINTSLSNLATLPAEAILSNVSTYLVLAGAKLELQVNASRINATIFGLSENANISTYYFRIRSTDAAGNVADWSNPVSASYINPALYIASSTTTATSAATTTTSAAATTATTTNTDSPVTVGKSGGTIILAIAVSVPCLLAAVIAGVSVACYCSKQSPKQPVESGYGNYYSTPIPSQPSRLYASIQRPRASSKAYSAGSTHYYSNAAYY